ncbi:hypothetical protein DH09_16955 [Bacillaceae bacterium JMAK1]|nr:hypothetical protein DH09_16955 [Bacillaceae bacterium JMAK1]
MKKLAFLLTLILLTFMPIACDNSNETSDNEAPLYIEGVVSEINRLGFSFTIEIDEESYNHLSGSVIVRISMSNTFKYYRVKEGDYIRVGYDGVEMESYPVQINASSFEILEN